MIVVTLSGGLGNQLFQYAAGRALACRHQTTLKLDISRYAAIPAAETPREYLLDHLNIHAEIASASELESIFAASARQRFGLPWPWKGSASLPGSTPFSIYHEQLNRFNRDFLVLPDNICLCGYWQSERYFSGIGDSIRREFEPARDWSPENLRLAEEISGTHSVSLHVRRGDYVTDEQARLAHGTCSLKYYATCMEEIGKKVASVHVYVFSDDPQWAADNIRTHFQRTIVEHNVSPAEAVFDLSLMGLCKHNIIANSSFSWWGAWLNRNPRKMVFAPSQWFCLKEAQDLLPPSWIKI